MRRRTTVVITVAVVHKHGCRELTLRRKIYVGIGYRDYWLFDEDGNKLPPKIVRKGIWYYKTWNISTCGTYYLLVIKRNRVSKRGIAYTIITYSITNGAKRYLGSQIVGCSERERDCINRAIKEGFFAIRFIIKNRCC
jgi:hypothetical protein